MLNNDVPIAIPIPISLPRDHADYIALNEPDTFCTCVLCVEYRFAVTPYLESAERTQEHSFRCKCPACKERRRLESEQLAKDNRRTLWCEACFTATGKPWGGLFLDWIENKILNDHTWAIFPKGKSTVYWWVHEGERRSIDWWLEEWLNETGYADKMISADKIMRDDVAVAKALQNPDA